MSVCGVPSDVGANKDDTNSHDGKERLESCVVLESGNSQALGHLVVKEAPTFAKEVRVVSSTHNVGQEHV